MRRCVVAAHSEGALQQAEDSSVRSVESSGVLKLAEDETGRLLVIVGCENGDEADEEGGNIPDQNTLREFIEDVWQENIRTGSNESDATFVSNLL